MGNGTKILISIDKGFGLISPVFLSQYTLRYLKIYQDNQRVVIIGSQIEKDHLDNLRLNFNYEFIVVKPSLVSKLWALFSYVKSTDVIIARGIWTALASLCLGKRYVYDVRGSLLDEAILRRSKIVAFLQLLEFIIVRCSMENWTVTTYLSEVMTNRYRGSKFVHKGFCQCSSAIVKIDKLNFNRSLNDEAPRLVYSGGVSQYQCVEETLVLWQQLRKRISATFLVYSKVTKEEFVERFGNELLRGVEVRSVSPVQLPYELNKCHIGFMLRDKSEVNAVSSPVKFADYLVAGCKVITTKHVGVVNEYPSSDTYIIDDLNSYNVDNIANWIIKQRKFTLNSDFIL